MWGKHGSFAAPPNKKKNKNKRKEKNNKFTTMT